MTSWKLSLGEKRDFIRLADWINKTPEGKQANGASDPVSITGLEANWRTTRFLKDSSDEPLVAVYWKPLGDTGSYSAGIIADSVRGHNLGGLAAGLLFLHLFHELNAHRVEVRTCVDNLSTMRLLKSDMMRVEGILREAAFGAGRYRDIVVAALLRDEFDDRLNRGIFGRIGISNTAESAQARELFSRYYSQFAYWNES